MNESSTVLSNLLILLSTDLNWTGLKYQVVFSVKKIEMHDS